MESTKTGEAAVSNGSNERLKMPFMVITRGRKKVVQFKRKG